MSDPGNRWERLKAAIGHAFAYDDGRDEVTDEDLALLDRLAEFVARRHMETPAMLFLESTAPLNFVGSSVMAFFRPFVGMAFRTAEYERFERLLELRCSVPLLVDRIQLAANRRDAAKKAANHSPEDPDQTDPSDQTDQSDQAAQSNEADPSERGMGILPMRHGLEARSSESTRDEDPGRDDDPATPGESGPRPTV